VHFDGTSTLSLHTIIVRDFSKGLRAIYTAKAALDLRLTKIINKPFVCSLNKTKEMPKATKVVVSKAVGIL